jgi:NAD(P)-dependent dehydrogenase (short-subunit alcohol dehydrogenase family)
MRLAETGATVGVGDRNLKLAGEVARKLVDRFGGSHMPIELDITETESLRAAIHAVRRSMGGLEIWINNAGIFPASGPVLDITDEFVDHLLLTNVRGTFAASREAARAMNDGGVIVNLASTAAFRAMPGVSVYSASKHAVVGLTKSLALELADAGIRVLGVAPTGILTPGVDQALEALTAAGLEVERLMAANLLGRAGVPDDVARVVLFCVSDLSAFMTGSTLLVDAGDLAH